ncbi:MAG: hypothetical protein Fur0039_26660 [Rhodocyclaceae bacterium]
MSAPEGFLKRWSRLKGEARRGQPRAEPIAPAAAPGAAPEAPLPPPESLDFSSDYTAFLGAKVEESVKRAALGKLFRSAHFNEMDGLDVYIDDYSRSDPVPPEMLARLNQASELLFREQQTQGAAERGGEAAAQDQAAAAREAPAPAGIDPLSPDEV